ncbi:MAG: NAD(+) synthase [Gammaproteobacteria bacterium]|nr:NAD(+) synthase [Gammaproteobacteria bacterium]
MNYADHGYLRVAAVAPTISLANPVRNAERILAKYHLLSSSDCAVVLTPELSVTGYSCEDLFLTADLQRESAQTIADLAYETGPTLLIVGAPLLLVDGRLVNAAFVLAHGRILGAVPKSSNPNHAEFYEQRWFASGVGIDAAHEIESLEFRVSPKHLFRVGSTYCAVEICEDLWMPQPPSAQHALNGATLILNPSASPEQVAKADYRRDLVRMQSGACIGAYLYASSTVSESSKDVVYGGHLLAAENGVTLGESELFLNDAELLVDIDWHRLRHERAVSSTFRTSDRSNGYRIVGQPTNPVLKRLRRDISPHPFVPDDADTLDARANTIFKIQTHGLIKRLQSSGTNKMVIGLSGGLDSTLALLVCMDVQRELAWKPESIVAVTMPGPGTSTHTRESVALLTRAARLKLEEIPISTAVESHLADIRHDSRDDVTYENSQARERTQVLFDLANKINGIVVGTGDLSELALGWCTFNADHMSSYNVNVGVPKTLVQYLTRWYAQRRASSPLQHALERVLETPITPELLPVTDDEIAQRTEEIVGPFELHDFFLYHFLRTGGDVAKIRMLANLAYHGAYSAEEVDKWLRVFVTRFHRQQYKRTTLPPGPKIGTVSLSPRGDWRMPDEADWQQILKGLDEIH